MSGDAEGVSAVLRAGIERNTAFAREHSPHDALHRPRRTNAPTLVETGPQRGRVLGASVFGEPTRNLVGRDGRWEIGHYKRNGQERSAVRRNLSHDARLTNRRSGGNTAG
jgi:hypothetical protein